MPISQRDKRALTGGGLVIVLLLAYLLWPQGDAPPGPTPPQAVAPPPPAPIAVAPPAAPAVDLAPLHLIGVLGSGAVIGMADGSQRFVRVGGQVIPGVILRGVDVHHAILQTSAGEVRLGFDSATPSVDATPPSR